MRHTMSDSFSFDPPPQPVPIRDASTKNGSLRSRPKNGTAASVERATINDGPWVAGA